MIEMKLLTDICDIQYGYPFDSSKFNNNRQGMPLIRIRDVVRGFSETHTSEDYADEYIITKGELLIGMDGEFNISQWGNEPALLNQRVCHLIPKKVDKSYLFYFMPSALKKIEQKTPFVTVKHLSAKELNKIEVPLPTLDEQVRIASVLDKVSCLISKKNEQLNRLDNLVKSRFIELFGDPATPGEKFKTSKLGEVADVKSSHRVFTTEFVDEGVPFYRGTEIGALASGQQPEDPYRISIEHYLKIASDDSKPIRGDLLLPSICNKGQVWMVDTDEPFYYKDGRVLCISPDRSVFDSRYLQFYMKIRTEAEYPKLGSGSTFAEFKIFQLKELEVDIPPINAQKEFNLFADQVDKSKLAVEQGLQELETLKKSLMQQYFG